MSLKKIIDTDLAPKAIGPYSQATSSGNTFYVSGQLGVDVVTGELPEGFTAQVKNALYNLKAIVEACESRLDRILQVTVFLTDINNFQELNEIYGQFFQAQPPARVVLEVSNLPKGGLIEICATGFIQDSL
jgi:2-iminobutanoate/2-iminopropanoate deaminase